ncbi:MAG: hypothetical protein U0359_37040 [Byssovorax sp.]
MNRALVSVVSLLGLAALVAPAHDAVAAPPDAQIPAVGAKVREITRKELHARADAKLAVLVPFGAAYMPKAESAMKGPGFDSAGFTKSVEALEAKPLTQASLNDFIKASEGKLESLYAGSGLGIQDNGRTQLAGKLNSTLLGRMLSFVSNRQPPTPGGGGDDKGGPPMPVKVSRLNIRLNTVLMPTGGVSSPDGSLHVHAVTHLPSGEPAESYAALAGELGIEAGTNAFSVDVPFRTTLSVALAATPSGYVVAETAVRLRVMEKRDGGAGKELCSAGTVVSSATAAVIGLAHQEAANEAKSLSCRVKRATTSAEQVIVIFEETAYAMVKGPGAAHALLDGVLGPIPVVMEHP